MSFGISSAKSYLFGLIVVSVIFLILYLLLFNLQLVNLNAELALILGLLLGHFVGASISTAPAKKKNITDKAEIKTLYVGNLSFKISRNELRKLFESYGDVHAARIMVDKATRKPRGYGFVEMNSRDAKNAIIKLNGAEFAGRNIKVTEANEKGR